MSRVRGLGNKPQSFQVCEKKNTCGQNHEVQLFRQDAAELVKPELTAVEMASNGYRIQVMRLNACSPKSGYSQNVASPLVSRLR